MVIRSITRRYGEQIGQPYHSGLPFTFMSTQIAQVGELNINQFFGGNTRGLCLQFTVPFGRGYAQLRNKEVREVVAVLQNWLAERELDLGPDRLSRLIEKAKSAMAGDSNDAEHDALYNLVKALEERQAA